MDDRKRTQFFLSVPNVHVHWPHIYSCKNCLYYAFCYVVASSVANRVIRFIELTLSQQIKDW